MNPSTVQVAFFQHLKAHLPPHIAMVDEIADLLQISNDSAYRRIRGEKQMDLEETHTLCRHYRISMDKLLELETDTFIFSGKLKNGQPEYAFDEWLKDVHDQFQKINSFEKKHVHYLMKDIPPFVHFQVPELAVFRCFLYLKSIIADESLKGIKFTHEDSRYDKYITRCKQISVLYNQVPMSEIWNIETLNSTLNQIKFYSQAGAFASISIIKMLFEKLETLINHIEKQAESGRKFNIGETAGPAVAEYKMFVNELILGNNTLLAELGDNRVTYLNHSVLYFISTSDIHFNNEMFGNLQNLVKKSTMISTIGEKERAGFFNRLRGRIHRCAQQLT